MRRRRIISGAIITGLVAASSVTGFFVVHREPLVSARIPNPTKFSEIAATQEIRYQVAPKDKKWGKPRHLKNAITILRKAMAPHSGHGFQLRAPRNDWSQKRSLHASLRRLHLGVAHSGVGAIWRIRPFKRKAVWKIHKIDINPAKIANTEGTQAVDIIVGSSLHKFPALQIWGIYQCRYIIGTNTLSQHAYGNAVDWGGSSYLLDALAKWQYHMTKRGWLPISQILWKGHDWFTGSYVYDHYDHLHDSGKPYLSGGGCNRPGTRTTLVTPTATNPTELDGQEPGEQ